MIFLLFLFSGISVVNLLLTLFFPYPAPLIGIGLQFAFFLISILVFISRIRKKRGLIRSFIMTSYHTSALLLILYLFYNVTLPNRQENESDAFFSALRGLRNFFQEETPQSPTELSDKDSNPSLDISSNPQNPDIVDDPF